VLKGPQGTLFGRNSEAGAINVVTRRPGKQVEGDVRTQWGEQNQYLAEAAGGGPLSDSLSVRIALRGTGGDSPVRSAANGKPVLRAKDIGGRASLLWQPQTATSLLWVSERQDQEGRAGLEAQRPLGQPPTQNVSPGIQYGTNVQDRHSLEVNHELEASRLTSITSLLDNDSDQMGCQSRAQAERFYGVPAELCQLVNSRYRVLNQDLRWASAQDASGFWVTGVNVNRTKRRYDNALALFGMDNNRWFETRSHGVYGEVTWPLGKALKLTAGARHTWEDKEYRGEFLSAFGPASGDQRELSDNYSTGRIALAYELSERTNAYVVVARGYKSGGFTDYASQIADGTPLKSAVVHNLEVGIKTESPDRTLIFNTALFHNRAKDDHLLGFDPATLASKGLNTDTESSGAEFDLIWRIDDSWELRGGANFTDAEITRDVFNVSGGDVAAGNRVPDAARWSAVTTLAYTTPSAIFGGVQFDALLSYRFLGSRAADPQNHFELPTNQKIDLRAGFNTERFEVYAWGDNLLDKYNELYAYYYAPDVSTGMVSRGRTFGLGANYSF
jgi:iron complex outermembrane receptor protein